MKQLKLFFALFAMLALGVGNAWGAEATLSSISTKNVVTTKGQSVSTTFDGVTCTVTRNSGNQPGFYTSSGIVRYYSSDVMKLSVASGNVITKIVFTMNSGTVGTANPTGLSSDSKTWTGSAESVSFTGSTTVKISKIVVTYEASGSTTPDPDPENPNPGTGGESLTYTWDLSKASHSEATSDKVTWSSTDVNMVLTKESSLTNANNYLGGTNTHTRVYKSQKITFTPEENVTITSIEITATSSTYAGNFANATWSNGSASTSNTIVTVTPTNGANAVSCTIGTATRATGVTVHYTKSGSGSGETVPSLTQEQFSWSATTATATLPDQFDSKPTLTNTENLDVTYSSSNEDVAKIDASGNVTLVGKGETVISATAGDDETYKKTTVSYTLTVNKAPATPTDNVYVKVTTTAGITDGEYLIVYEDAEGNPKAPVAFDGSLETLDAVGNNIDVTINSNTIAGNNDIDKATFTIDATAGTILSASGKYIGVTSYDNGLKQNAESSAYGAHSFEISEGNAIVKIVIADKGDMILNYNPSTNNGQRFRYYKGGSQKPIALYKKVDPSEILAPAFSVAAGSYYDAQSVEITCATADVEIYYTLDGSTPSSTSTKYTSAVAISETKTLKAIAIKGEYSSSVTEATYTILAPLATMQEIFDKATDATQSVHIKFNEWVISGVVPGKDGKPSSNAYITDGSKGFIIYTKDGHRFNVGNKLSGTVVCDLTRYNGSAEVVGLTLSTEGLTVTADGDVTPVEVADKSTLSGVNTGAVIKITGVCETKNVNSKDYFYVGGIQLFNSLFAYDNPTVGGKYNVTGIYLQYNDIPEILPRSADDIEEINDLATATIAIADMTMLIGESKTIEATITPDAAKTTVQYAITSGREYITLDGTTITAVSVGEATITATIAEVAGEYYGATKTFNVTVKPQNIAELPFEFTGVRADIENTLGMSQDGLGTDYTTAGVTTNLKFDGTGDWVIIHFNGQADKLAYDIKGNSFSGGKFTVQQSSDGSTYTEVVTYTELGDAATKEHVLAAESRYVKFIYTEKSSGNVGLGNITISKADLRQETGLAWNPATVSLTVGDAFTAPTLSNPNSLTVDFESDNTALATVTASGIVSLNTGVSGKAVIKATYAGNETYKAAEVTCVITVSPKSEKVVILAEYNGQWYALKAAYFSTYTNRLAAIPVNYVEGKLYNVADADKTTIEWQLAMNGAKATFKNGDNYLTGTDGTDLTLSTTAFEWDYDGELYLSDGGTRTFIYHKDGYFRNYATSNAIPNSTTYSDKPVVTAPVYDTAIEIGSGDNSTVIAANKNQKVNVIVDRAFEAGDEWYTLCVPFNMQASLIGTAYQLSGLVQKGTDYVEVNLAAKTTIEAGKPYLVKPNVTVNKFVVENVTIVNTTGESIAKSIEGLSVEMQGVINGSGTTGGLYWVGNSGYLYNDDVAKLGLRTYFNITTPSGIAPRMRVVAGENVETGVEDLFTTDAPVKVIENGQLIIIRDGVKYNVQGQKL